MKDRITEILKTEGILSQGFGISPKILYRDKRLTPEAKAIYGYIASFAGNGNTSFPSRDIMLDELGMSAKRYYKHFKLLIDCGYITVTKQRDKFGSFDKNIYTLVSNPVPVNVQSEERKKTASAGTKENSSQKVQDDAQPDCLRENMAIDAIMQQQPEDKSHLEKIYMAAADMAACEEIKLGGTVKDKQYIQMLLSTLTADHTRTVLFQYKKALSDKNYSIRNKKAFLQALICNSPFDMEDVLSSETTKKKAQEKRQQQEQLEADQEEIKMKQEEILSLHPALQELETLRQKAQVKLLKAALKNNKKEKEKILEEITVLDTKRDAYLQEHRLTDCI